MNAALAKKKENLTLLGIETSCDETAAAIIRGPGKCPAPDAAQEAANILANIIHSQFADHADYGGVVPEIAARAHVERVDNIIEQALDAAKCTMADIDAIAVTAGPGLVGGVMVGLTTAKAISLSHGIPLIPVNHLAAHALTARMVENIDFPFLVLLVSGGHTQLLWVESAISFRRLGTTIDDAAGEAFDKIAQLLGLPSPGGPHLESLAREGRADRFAMPRPLHKREGCDFSFSGLKTATRLLLEQELDAGDDHQLKADIAASFQQAAADHLAARTKAALAACERLLEGQHSPRQLVVAGGVAANMTVQSTLQAMAETHDWHLIVPPAKLCTDNGAMIAWAGLEMIRADAVPPTEQAMEFAARPRWPLDNNPEGPRHGGGKKGPKA